MVLDKKQYFSCYLEKPDCNWLNYMKLYMHCIWLQSYKQNKLSMSHKKPALTIEIDEHGEDLEPQFKGFVNYEYQNQDESREQENNQRRGSELSAKSNKSNRSAILQRSRHALLEERLAKNVKGISKEKSESQSQIKIEKMKGERVNASQTDLSQKRWIKKSKSADLIEHENSRAKILKEMVQKLKKYNKVDLQSKSLRNGREHKNYESNEVEEHSYAKAGLKIESLNQIKNKISHKKNGKLQNLLKDVKKSNKETYKVIYTIKKSVFNQVQFNQFQEKDKNGHPLGPNSFQLPLKSLTANNALGPKDKINAYETVIKQLQTLRTELKDVKAQNQQVLEIYKQKSISNSRSIYNQDIGSQSSRVTNRNIEVDSISNSSSKRIPNYRNPVVNFSNIPYQNFDHTSYYHVANIPSIPPNIPQACYACGCTCRGRVNLMK